MRRRCHSGDRCPFVAASAAPQSYPPKGPKMRREGRIKFCGFILCFEGGGGDSRRAHHLAATKRAALGVISFLWAKTTSLSIPLLVEEMWDDKFWRKQGRLACSLAGLLAAFLLFPISGTSLIQVARREIKEKSGCQKPKMHLLQIPAPIRPLDESCDKFISLSSTLCAPKH